MKVRQGASIAKPSTYPLRDVTWPQFQRRDFCSPGGREAAIGWDGGDQGVEGVHGLGGVFVLGGAAQ
jgi:hypothetical protein